MSEFDARLDRDAAILKRAQSLAQNPSYVMDFTASAIFLVTQFLTLVATMGHTDEHGVTHFSGFVGWAVFAAIIIGTAVVQVTPFGSHIPLAIVVILSLIVGGVAVYVAGLTGYVTLGVVLIGAVLVLATPNGGNFLLMFMATLSLGAALVTIWAAALAMFGATE
jgi:hypothetical protein